MRMICASSIPSQRRAVRPAASARRVRSRCGNQGDSIKPPVPNRGREAKRPRERSSSANLQLTHLDLCTVLLDSREISLTRAFDDVGTRRHGEAQGGVDVAAVDPPDRKAASVESPAHTVERHLHGRRAAARGPGLQRARPLLKYAPLAADSVNTTFWAAAPCRIGLWSGEKPKTSRRPNRHVDAEYVLAARRRSA